MICKSGAGQAPVEEVPSLVLSVADEGEKVLHV